MSKIMPQSSALSQTYWEGCRAGVLRLQRCAACDRFQFYPRIICSHCESRDLHWRDTSGRGQVASFTVVRRAISSVYVAPYVVALVDLIEGPRMMAAIKYVPLEQLRIGLAVEVSFENWDEETVVPVFTQRNRTTGDVL